MIDPQEFLFFLEEQGAGFFTGVPDSLMKGLLGKLPEDPHRHIIAANEGSAIALAAGYYLATGKLPIVYLQNSGLGNTINPLTSLANPEVYGIPMLLLIGWRGQPGKKDEPQHEKMGKISPAILEALDLPYFILRDPDPAVWMKEIAGLIGRACSENRPVALLIEADIFEDDVMERKSENYELDAEKLIRNLSSTWKVEDIVVCNTGKIGRLFYLVNGERKQPLKKYFLNVGAMGHVGSLAASLSFFTGQRVFLLDGDGSLLMHLGSLAVTGRLPELELVYILVNNGAHQSVGGQPTVGYQTDFVSIARACGFEKNYFIKNETDLNEWLAGAREGKQFVEVRVNTRMPEILPRPKENFEQARIGLMQELKNI
jgi:phosphonopyruvate decarboxylase